MNGPQKALAPYALWAAVNLAAESSDSPGQSVLISVAWQVRNFAKWCLSLLEQWEEVTPQFFVPPSDPTTIEVWESAQRACDDYFGAESTEGKLLKKGILVYYGRMPGRLPRLIVQLAERRALRIVIATSGLSQGVNLPFETVLVPALRRQDGAMARSEFWNLVGRAGRPGVSTEGQTLVLVNEDDATTWRRQQVLSDYRQVTRVVQETDDAAGSPLGDLLAAINASWPGADRSDFENWLETTAPLEITGDVDERTVALDTLDAVLIAALEDSDSNLGGVESQLRAFWRASFSRYAHREEHQLEAILLRRGNAVVRIYEDEPARRRIYLTGLPPRDALRLEAVADRLANHLRTGADYAERSRSEQLTFVLDAVEILAAHPRFAPRATVGNSSRTWRDVLSWWLLGWDAPISPSVAQAGPWHDFINNYFTYRFNWALGSALSLLAVSDAPEGSAMNLPEWPETAGLPWISVWLKDLLEWGTLDPVAAFLLARAGFATRPDAESASAAYYESDGARAEADPLAPDAVTLWARSLSTRPADAEASTGPGTISAELAPDLPEAAFGRTWPVIPSVSSETSLRWLDPSGRVLAVSARPEAWAAEWAQTVDFELQPSAAVVVATRYL